MDVHSILYRGPNPLEEEFKPRFDPNKLPTRHWPGKVPEHALVDSDNEEDSVRPNQTTTLDGVWESGGGQTVIDTEVQDKRLKLIQKAKDKAVAAGANIDPTAMAAERIRRRRQIRQSTVVVDGGDSTATTTAAKRGDGRGRHRRPVVESRELPGAPVAKEQPKLPAAGEDVATRRARLKAMALAKRKEEEEQIAAAQAAEAPEESEDEFYSSEGSKSEEEDIAARHVLRKPVYVPKSRRETIRERQLMEEEEVRRAESQKQRLVERKKETQSMVVQKLLKESEEMENERLKERHAGEYGEALLSVDDCDEVNAAEEYERWKIRELKRIKRDKEEREAREKFILEIERRRNMTEDERREDDRRLDAENPRPDKGSKYRFMQKYYHRGAFFQNERYSGEQPLYQRDVNLPVGEDMLDKKILPGVMQKRRGQFGFAGQTKYTHLADQDTTDFTAAWVQSEKTLTTPKTKQSGPKKDESFFRPTKKRAI